MLLYIINSGLGAAGSDAAVFDQRQKSIFIRQSGSILGHFGRRCILVMKQEKNPATRPEDEESSTVKPGSGEPAAKAARAGKSAKARSRLKFLPVFKRRRASSVQAAVAAADMRSKTAHNPLIVFGNFIFMLAGFIILAAALALYGVKNLYDRPGSLEQAQTILIPPGSGIQAIADLLKKQNIIKNAPVFVYGTYLGDKSKLLKAGEYEIPAGASMRDIADILARGRSVQHSVTVPEGLTVAQIFAKLAEEPLLTGDLPQNLPPEGSLMTNTVHFIRGTARREIIRRLAAGQAHLVEEIWARRAADLPLKSREEMVILASIVEKETSIAAERPRIAAVFYNRLKKHMRLQSDPTVLYGIFGGQGRPAGRPIYRSDLEQETAYNTYKIFGLPPTPICNPGRDSLLAVANPPQTEDLYFVADGSGGHIFSVTLGEHNSNVSKWRALKKARQGEQADSPENAGTEVNKPGLSALPDKDKAPEKRNLLPPPTGWRHPTWSTSSSLIEEKP